MVQELKKKFNSFSRERLRGHFYNAAKVANALGTGYVIAGETGAMISSIWFALSFVDAKAKYEQNKHKIPSNTYGEILQTESLGLQIKELKESFGIKDEMRILVTQGGSPAIRVGEAMQILIPQEFLDGLPPEELIEILKHEFAHQIMVSKHNSMASQAGDKTAKYSMYLGGLVSLITLNAIPFAAAYASRKTNAFLDSRQNIELENAADRFAVKNGDGKTYLSALSRLAYSNTQILLKAVHQQAQHTAQIPQRIRGYLNDKIPAFVQKLRIKADYWLHGSHPRDFNRLNDVADLIRAEHDPDFEFTPPQELQTFDICEGCMHQKTPDERARFIPYLRQAFRDTYGHDNFKTSYFNCGRDERPRGLPFPFFGGGSVIIVSSGDPDMGGMIVMGEGGFDDLDMLDQILDPEDEWPFPFPDPRKRGKDGGPKPGDGGDSKGLFRDLG
jgi:hypothetical protein